MDYSKAGGAKAHSDAPAHRESNAKGGKDNPFGRDDAKGGKAALLARMKAAAEARRSEKD